ncbi:MAG: RNA polymerase sigma factor [Clostridiales Family XIII bacterium]|jgi:RNA polymerase sigma-70 factor (ECF subfamily)|nr:RNA polymerase sigma factor [Clostridiales Family XIII bacterium]
MDKERITRLAAEAVSGDARAFEDLYSACAQTILFHCRNLIVDKNQYEDVAQEVAIALFRNIGTLKEPKAFSGWLHRIIRNTCINHNRRFMNNAESKNVQNSEETLAALWAESPDENPEQYVTDNAVFFDMLEDLPPIQRETLILRYYDGLSYREIANVLGSAVSTVSTNLIKAKRSLEKMTWQEDENRMMNTARIGDIITTGVSSLIPATAVSRFVETASVNILMTAESAGTAGATAAAGKAALGVGKGILLGTTCVAVIATGAYGVFSHNNAKISAQEAVSAAAIQEPAQIVTYTGALHLVFTNEAGEETRRNISAIRVTEDGAAAEETTWAITDENGAQILSGSGKTVTNGLDALPNGAYKAKFTLTEENGATAEISRSFFIDKVE